MHVLDASRGVPVAQSFVDQNPVQRQEFIDEIKEQYAELREEFYSGLEDRKWVCARMRGWQRVLRAGGVHDCGGRASTVQEASQGFTHTG